VKDRQSGALVQSLKGQVIRPKNSISKFNGLTLDPQGHRDPNYDSPAKVLMN
jgi:hypothetical protein